MMEGIESYMPSLKVMVASVIALPPSPPLVIYPLIRHKLCPLDPVTCKEAAPLYWVYWYI